MQMTGQGRAVITEKATPASFNARAQLLESAKMRILLFHFAELGGLGGVDVVVSTLARQFRQAGHEAGIIEIGKSLQPKSFRVDGTPVWRVIAPSQPTIRRPRSWASFIRTTAQFMSVVHQFQPDVVNVHFPLSQCLPIVGAHWLPHRWRLVVTLHNSDIRVAPFKDPAIVPWQDRIFDRAEAVTAVNRALLEDAIALYPAIRPIGKVITNGVGEQWFRPLAGSSNGKGYVFFAGRLAHVKGVDLLLKAWSRIRPSFPQTDLLLAGDGEDRESLKTMARELGIEDSVQFLGRRDHHELAGFYQHAQAVVLPSRREGLPLSLLEAGAAGAICIGSRTPGIPEIIQDGTTGLLTDTESVEDLSAGITKALSLSPTEQQRMKQAAQDAVRNRFSEQGMVGNYLKLFQSVKAS